MRTHFKFILIIIIILSGNLLRAEDGYKLWLRYAPLAESESAEEILRQVYIPDSHETFKIIKEEISRAAEGMIGQEIKFASAIAAGTSLIIGTPESIPKLREDRFSDRLKQLATEGYFVEYSNDVVYVCANTPVGALYGTFHLLRLIQSNGEISNLLPIEESPKIKRRILNHWDNLDRTVERGYAGFSIWNWHTLPDYIGTRYIDYARANASIGINGTVLTNVNANALVLTPQYLEKVSALAKVFRPYGIKVYLTARFSSPIEIGDLETADPMVPEVRQWWKDKVDEIYEKIPDFGGFLVKANSEGQPGPQNYDRTHADGANMLALALAPHGGIVIWRAFVYSHEVPEDRAKQANNEFEPLDGKFHDNVFIQVKNGPIDFQPREPFHPLFGAMPNTKLALELQITMEYLGQATSLVYLAPLFKECLDSQTYRPEKSSTVADVIDGSAYENVESAIAGVSNIGNDRNWTGHLFNQANWYCYGRLAWDPALSSEEIAEEWIHQTFGNSPDLTSTILDIMMPSRETVVNYMTPLGLHHIMGRNHHYGPGPWVAGGRPDWTSVYYHKADTLGIGFDRTATGSDALSQYASEIEKEWSDPKTCPDKYLLWFHHLPWDYNMKSGNTLWDELCMKYDLGVKSVGEMKEKWSSLEHEIDSEKYKHVRMLLNIQEKEAQWWKNSCLLYFQQFSGRPFPENIEPPKGELDYYMNLRFPYAPGIRPRW
jgi:alpha-glucuronidase